MDLQYAYNWLSIMSIIKQDLVIVLKQDEKKNMFAKILFLMLYPYQESDPFSLEQETNMIQRDINIIYKCIHLYIYIFIYEKIQ